MGFGRFAATSQFYLYGRKHFTRTGWENHQRGYEQPDLLKSQLDLSERVFIVTGANSGVGKEVARFLGSKGARVFMLCRSRDRAEAAKAEIDEAVGGTSKITVLVGDVGLESDVRRCWREFAEHMGTATPRLDGVVCNAGALLNEKELTGEGVEVTLASHLLFGTYLLGSLAMPRLKATEGSRFIAVSSGGMLNVPFPSWEIATSTSTDPKAKYDGQLAYAHAKRGQVLLCEQWAKLHPEVKAVSCHPGWTSTPAVDKAYGEQQKYLQPMRSTWEGAEGLIWLCVAPAAKLESGAFYLDRSPQAKHMAGLGFSEGSYTKNSPQEVKSMMDNLNHWANGEKPSPAELVEASKVQAAGSQAAQTPAVAWSTPIDIHRFMGRWYVIRNIPTPLDRGTVNNIEDYAYDPEKKTIQVTFAYSNKELTKTTEFLQRATVKNEAHTQWALSPKLGCYLPLNIPYLVLDCAEDYSTTIVGVPNRAYIWIMARTPTLEPEAVEALVKKAQLLGYDVSKLDSPAQMWEKKGAPPSVSGAGANQEGLGA